MLRRQCPSLRSPCQIGKTSKLEACQIIAKHSLTTAKEMITHINTYYTLNPRKYTINFSPPRFHCHGLRPRQHGNLVTHPNVVLDVIDHSQHISIQRQTSPCQHITNHLVESCTCAVCQRPWQCTQGVTFTIVAQTPNPSLNNSHVVYATDA